MHTPQQETKDQGNKHLNKENEFHFIQSLMTPYKQTSSPSLCDLSTGMYSNSTNSKSQSKNKENEWLFGTPSVTKFDTKRIRY